MAWLRNAVRLLTSGYDALVKAGDDARASAKLLRKADETAADLRAEIAEVHAAVKQLRRDIGTLRDEERSGLRQYHLQLGRLTRAVERAGGSEAAEEPHLALRSVPLDVPDAGPMVWDGIGVSHPDPDGREWTYLEACPGCGHDRLTIVNPWNKLLLLATAPDNDSARYDYAICHACGILAALRRPFGSRFQFLLEHFEEVTAKRDGGEITNPLLNPRPLQDADRERLRRLAAPGVFVSDASETARSKAYLPGLMRDRFDSSGHLDIIGSLLQPRNARVLEVRAKTGALVDGLRRHWNADVYSMPIWESQQFVVQEFYGIPASRLIDFDHFSIPFEGTFDLIVCQHMLTHVLRPAEFLARLRERLNPGGHIYLYNEPDDVEFLGTGQSMIAHLNPLHMQAFDQPSLTRVLAANGFDVVFLKRHDLEHLCLARVADVQMSPMDDAACRRRIELYRRAYDRSILRLDESVRPRVAQQWAEVVERAVAAGTAEFDKHGRLRIVAG